MTEFFALLEVVSLAKPIPMDSDGANIAVLTSHKYMTQPVFFVSGNSTLYQFPSYDQLLDFINAKIAFIDQVIENYANNLDLSKLVRLDPRDFGATFLGRIWESPEFVGKSSPDDDSWPTLKKDWESFKQVITVEAQRRPPIEIIRKTYQNYPKGIP